MGKIKFALMSLTEDDQGPPDEVLLAAALNSFTDEQLLSELGRRSEAESADLFAKTEAVLDKMVREWSGDTERG